MSKRRNHDAAFKAWVKDRDDAVLRCSRPCTILARFCGCCLHMNRNGRCWLVYRMVWQTALWC